MRDGARDSVQPPPSTAEFLDAVRACLKFNIQPGDSELWNAINSAVLIKKTQAPLRLHELDYPALRDLVVALKHTGAPGEASSRICSEEHTPKP